MICLHLQVLGYISRGLTALLSLVLLVTASGCGEPCGTGTQMCGGACVDTLIDTRNCGQCNISCKAGEVCSNGKCSLTCQSTLTNCNGTCVNMQSDRKNCGTCDSKCDATKMCVSGKCANQCPSGWSVCSDTCVNMQTDRANCGTCGTKCNAGEVCSAGKCTLSCQKGLTTCNKTCVNTKTDLSNCGTCGTTCKSGEVCSAGMCALTCQKGLTTCNKTCVNTSTDLFNCGTCSTKCKAGETCSAGKCALSCPANMSTCSGVCANLKSDPYHCGKCGVKCSSGQVCSASTCALSCQSTLTNCMGICSNLKADLANCGACGTKCKAGEICSAGKCVLSCPSALKQCSGTCVNTSTDLANCGTCATKCKAGEVCSAGKCALTCQSGLSVCSKTCVDLQKNASNCGSCGNACSVGTACAAGYCKLACNNQALDPGEQCDGNSLLGGQTCKKLGYQGGTLACGTSCSFDTSKCYKCGDNLLNNTSEECDGLQLGGKTCQSLGYGSGVLACTSSCKLDKSSCTLPDKCGNSALLDLSTGSATVTGDTTSATNTISLGSTGCTSTWGTAGADLFYALPLKAGRNYQISVKPTIQQFDPAVYLFENCFNAAGTCVAGVDIYGKGKTEILKIIPTKTGTYHLAVDSYSLSHSGSFNLQVQMNSSYLTLSELNVGASDYIAVSNRTGGSLNLGGYTIEVNEPSSTSNFSITLPSQSLANGGTFYLCENSNCSASNTYNIQTNIIYTGGSDGTVYLCVGTCSPTTVVDVLNFTASGTSPTLLYGTTFKTAAVTGLTNATEDTMSFVRSAYNGYPPNFLQKDWKVAAKTK